MFKPSPYNPVFLENYNKILNFVINDELVNEYMWPEQRWSARINYKPRKFFKIRENYQNK
jgi:hypothetical protein